MDEIDSYDENVQKRLRKIERNWDRFTAFYFVEGAPSVHNLSVFSWSIFKARLRNSTGILCIAHPIVEWSTCLEKKGFVKPSMSL